jgi:hypothetical protein
VAEPFIFINSYRVPHEKQEEYRKKFQEVSDLVKAKEPKMLYFGEHVSEDGSQFTTVQFHADAENMGFHMGLVADHIQEVMEYLDPSFMSIRIFGSPTEAVLDQMRAMAGSGVSVTVSPAVVSFNRFE